MYAEDREDRDPLQYLVAKILEAANRGEIVDYDALIEENPEPADSQSEYSVTHDQLKSVAEIDPSTLPASTGRRSENTAGPDTSSLAISVSRWIKNCLLHA